MPLLLGSTVLIMIIAMVAIYMWVHNEEDTREDINAAFEYIIEVIKNHMEAELEKEKQADIIGEQYYGNKKLLLTQYRSCYPEGDTKVYHVPLIEVEGVRDMLEVYFKRMDWSYKFDSNDQEGETLYVFTYSSCAIC